MNALGVRGLIAALVLGLALGAWAAWSWQASHYGKQLAQQAEAYSRDREQAAVAVIDWQESEQVAHRAHEDRIKAIDETHYREFSDAQKNISRLRDRLATADVRLSVLLAAAPGGSGGVPTTSGTVGLVHGGTRVQLDPAHAQRIIGITDAGDQGLKELAACQAYAKEVSGMK